MIINRESLLELAPIKNMEPSKIVTGGVTAGMSEAGYDIRIKQTITFLSAGEKRVIRIIDDDESKIIFGRFTIASAEEEFQMPHNLTGVVHDKSSWARKGLAVFNTIIEPGWNGFLTLELVYHGEKELTIPAGSGIAQVVFHLNSDSAKYEGRYQNQADRPVEAIAANTK